MEPVCSYLMVTYSLGKHVLIFVCAYILTFSSVICFIWTLSIIYERVKHVQCPVPVLLTNNYIFERVRHILNDYFVIRIPSNVTLLVHKSVISLWNCSAWYFLLKDQDRLYQRVSKAFNRKSNTCMFIIFIMFLMIYQLLRSINFTRCFSTDFLSIVWYFVCCKLHYYLAD